MGKITSIDGKEVDRAFVFSGYKKEDEEVKGLNPDEAPKGAIIVNGVLGRYGFHPQRIENYRDKVVAWLELLPREFKEGGGWSLLNAYQQENGVQWTGQQALVERLFCLAMGLGLARWVDRDFLYIKIEGDESSVAVTEEMPTGKPEGDTIIERIKIFLTLLLALVLGLILSVFFMILFLSIFFGKKEKMPLVDMLPADINERGTGVV